MDKAYFPEYEKYIRHQYAERHSEHTLRGYQTSIERFFDYFDINSIQDLDALDTPQFMDYRDHLLSSGLKSTSAKSHFLRIKAFLNWMSAMKYIDMPDLKPNPRGLQSDE